MAILLSKSKTMKVADNSHFILPEKRKLSDALMECDKRKDVAITTNAKLLIVFSLYPLQYHVLTQICLIAFLP